MTWPFRDMPSYEHRCPKCGQHMLESGGKAYCAYAVCPDGKLNHEQAKRKGRHEPAG